MDVLGTVSGVEDVTIPMLESVVDSVTMCSGVAVITAGIVSLPNKGPSGVTTGSGILVRVLSALTLCMIVVVVRLGLVTTDSMSSVQGRASVYTVLLAALSPVSRIFVEMVMGIISGNTAWSACTKVLMSSIHRLSMPPCLSTYLFSSQVELCLWVISIAVIVVSSISCFIALAI